MSFIHVLAISIFTSSVAAASSPVSTSCSDSPCHNDAICKNYIDEGYICDCTGNWTGKNCDIPITLCTPDSCNNGATCVNDFSTDRGYRCQCAPGYYGSSCELLLSDVEPHAVYAICQSFECLNGGNCMLRRGQPMCNCPIGFSGFRCEIEDPKQVFEDTMTIISNDNQDTVTVEFIESEYTVVSEEAEPLPTYTVLPIWQTIAIIIIVMIAVAVGKFYIKRYLNAFQKQTLLPTKTPTMPSPDNTISTFDRSLPIFKDLVHHNDVHFCSSAPEALHDCLIHGPRNSRLTGNSTTPSPNTTNTSVEKSEAIPFPKGLEHCSSAPGMLTNFHNGSPHISPIPRLNQTLNDRYVDDSGPTHPEATTSSADTTITTSEHSKAAEASISPKSPKPCSFVPEATSTPAALRQATSKLQIKASGSPDSGNHSLE